MTPITDNMTVYTCHIVINLFLARYLYYIEYGVKQYIPTKMKNTTRDMKKETSILSETGKNSASIITHREQLQDILDYARALRKQYVDNPVKDHEINHKINKEVDHLLTSISTAIISCDALQKLVGNHKCVGQLKTAKEWLSSIANKTIRESALKQCTARESTLAENLPDAINMFIVWYGTKEGIDYWRNVYNKALDGTLEIILPSDDNLHFNHKVKVAISKRFANISARSYHA